MLVTFHINDWNFSLSGTLILGGLIVVLVWLVGLKSRRRWSLPPGPTALPIVGNLLVLDKKAPFKTLLEWSKIYGPVMTVYMGPNRVVVLVGYDTVKEALVDQADDFTGRGPLITYNFLSNKGLGISNGERWSQLRRFTLTTLRDFGMGRKGMEEWIQEPLVSTQFDELGLKFFLNSMNFKSCFFFQIGMSFKGWHIFSTAIFILKESSSR
uniref:Uncharacterized protein n=1 Tax=Salarias fasciatus TaxID=181472 RepID=A0A672IMK3_SALFA